MTQLHANIYIKNGFTVLPFLNEFVPFDKLRTNGIRIITCSLSVTFTKTIPLPQTKMSKIRENGGYLNYPIFI